MRIAIIKVWLPAEEMKALLDKYYVPNNCKIINPSNLNIEAEQRKDYAFLNTNKKIEFTLGGPENTLSSPIKF